MKTISQMLEARARERAAHERYRRIAVTTTAICIAALVGCITAAAVVKTARIVAHDRAVCEAKEARCAGAEW